MDSRRRSVLETVAGTLGILPAASHEKRPAMKVHGSKIQSQTKLNGSRLIHLRCHATKQRSPHLIAWGAEPHAIERVVDLRGELHVDVRDANLLGK